MHALCLSKELNLSTCGYSGQIDSCFIRVCGIIALRSITVYFLAAIANKRFQFFTFIYINAGASNGSCEKWNVLLENMNSRRSCGRWCLERPEGSTYWLQQPGVSREYWVLVKGYWLNCSCAHSVNQIVLLTRMERKANEFINFHALHGL